MRARLFMALYSDTALETSSRGTISLTKERRTGLSIASNNPPTMATP